MQIDHAPTADGLRFLPSRSLLAGLISARDWSATPVGPAPAWPSAIKSVLASWLDSPQAMFVAWGPELQFFFNEAYLPFLGARGADVVGQPFHEVWPEIWDQVEPIVRDALAGDGRRYEEMPLLMQRNGYPEQTWWTFTYMPLRDENGEVIGMMCTTSEVTASVLPARRAEQQQALQENMLQQMPGFIGLLGGPTHVYEYVNDAYRAFSGERDILGRTVQEVFPELAGQGYLELLDQVYRTGEPFLSHAMPIRLAGENADRHIDLLYYPVRDGLGAVAGIFVGGYDVTKRVRAELDLRSLNDTLEQRVQQRTAELMKTQEALRQSQKVEAIGQLTGGVAHDFNNLLTVIGSAVELLRRPQLAEERRAKYVETIAETVRRAAKLTSQLLAFARRQPLKPEVFVVSRQLASIAELVMPLMGPGIDVRVPENDAEWQVECDVNQFETALVNLAVNARDAMAQQGGTVCFEVGRTAAIPAARNQPGRVGDFVAVSVSDTGHGIAADRLERVFDPFFTTKEVGKGTGLGLSQVFGFTNQSGGDVRVESSPGQGATFTLYLPRAVAARADESAPEPVLPADPEPVGATVLVVEDNEQVGRVCTEILADMGYETEWATDGARALEILARQGSDFDLVFSDVMMPGMTGIELAHTIHRLYPGLPVLLASGYSEVFAEVGVQGLELIQKPYSVDALTRVMRRLLAGRARHS